MEQSHNQKPQRFVAHRAKTAGFKPGLRDYLEYRDLGLADATQGAYHAHVIRAAKPSQKQGGGKHTHQLNFQMNYVIKGTVTMWLEGEGEQTFGPGDAWLQPAGCVHDLLDYSDDAEWLEVVSPAEFDTRPA